MEITDLLVATSKNKASDLHISTKSPPLMRINGDILPLDMPPLSAEDVKRMLFSIMKIGRASCRERVSSPV